MTDGERLADAMVRALQEVGAYLLQQARMNAPLGSGNLRASSYMRKLPRGFVVGFSAPYAAAVEANGARTRRPGAPRVHRYSAPRPTVMVGRRTTMPYQRSGYTGRGSGYMARAVEETWRSLPRIMGRSLTRRLS